MFAPSRLPVPSPMVRRMLAMIISGSGFAVRETTVDRKSYLCTPIEPQIWYCALGAHQLLVPCSRLLCNFQELRGISFRARVARILQSEYMFGAATGNPCLFISMSARRI